MTNNLGGIKHDADKPRMELISSVAIEELAKVLTFGAKKYTADNWRQGFEWRRLVGAALRHLFAFLRGEDKDSETGLSHVAHAMGCCMFLLEHQSLGLGRDDRWTQPKRETPECSFEIAGKRCALLPDHEGMHVVYKDAHSGWVYPQVRSPVKP